MSQAPGQKNITKALLAGVQLLGTSDFEFASSMDELERLVKTLGFVTIGRVTQKRQYPAAGLIFGKGKLQEIASWTGGSGVVRGFKKGQDSLDEEYDDEWETHEEQATILILDCELTPTQLSNLQEASGVEVLDRTGVILEIFNRHAKSREARLQVEIAKLAYMAPRLRVSRLGSDRQGGGIGAKGSGETAHELDRRRIRDRIAELRQQLKIIRVEQINRRAHRQDVPLVALIGYTNAGKSSLMRELTGTKTEGEDKLFATLDTTIRSMYPATTPRILISDTVGFIKKLPHDLVASFRSTLDEALSASLLLFTVDGSDPNFRSQLEVTKNLMAEIGASDIIGRIVINKIDLVEKSQLLELQTEFPDALFISAQNPHDIKTVRNEILNFFEEGMIEQEVLIPYTKGHVIGKIQSRARVIRESHDEHGTLLTVKAHEDIHAWIRKQF